MPRRRRIDQVDAVVPDRPGVADVGWSLVDGEQRADADAVLVAHRVQGQRGRLRPADVGAGARTDELDPE